MTGLTEATPNEEELIEKISTVTTNDALDEVSSKEQYNLFSLDILHVIKEAQGQHGLRHGDYQRYHGYCNRRLKRIRKVLKFKMGEKRKVIPKKVTEAIFTDPR